MLHLAALTAELTFEVLVEVGSQGAAKSVIEALLDGRLRHPDGEISPCY